MDALSGRTIEGRKTVTVVFCDLVAYTELAERPDPEALFSTNTSTARSSTTSRGAGTAPTARRGAWDASTGHGTPRGRAIVEALSA
jgi:hypothetical protein